MNLPDDCLFTKGHDWIRIEGDTGIVGITDFAQSELGDIIFVEYPDIGQTVAQNDPFGTIEAVKTVADLFAPVSGEIVGVNEALEDAPETVNEDPYGDGWLVKIKLSNSAEKENLLSAQDYETFVDED